MIEVKQNQSAPGMGGKVFSVLRAVPVVLDQRQFCPPGWDVWPCLKSFLIVTRGGGGGAATGPSGWQPGLLFHILSAQGSPLPPNNEDAEGMGQPTSFRAVQMVLFLIVSDVLWCGFFSSLK